MRPVLRWVGGKWRNAKKFEKYFPPKMSRTLYVEPFFGSGGLFFFKKPRHAIISDINKQLMNVYYCIKHDHEKLILLLKEHDKKDSEVHYYEIRKQYNLFKNAKINTEQAARIIYLNARSFNGLYRENSKGEYNSPYATNLKGMKKLCNEKNIISIHKFLKNNEIVILDDSYEQTMKKIHSYAFVSKFERVFFFIDPPYYPLSQECNFTTYVGDLWREDACRNLKKFVDDINERGYYFLLCNHAVDFIRDLFSEYNQVEHSVSRHISCKARDRKPADEILIMNYRITGLFD